jgi:hypothetical protein
MKNLSVPRQNRAANDRIGTEQRVAWEAISTYPRSLSLSLILIIVTFTILRVPPHQKLDRLIRKRHDFHREPRLPQQKIVIFKRRVPHLGLTPPARTHAVDQSRLPYRRSGC